MALSSVGRAGHHYMTLVAEAKGLAELVALLVRGVPFGIKSEVALALYTLVVQHKVALQVRAGPEPNLKEKRQNAPRR